MIALALYGTAIALLVCSLAALLTGRLRLYQVWAAQAIGNGLQSIANIIDHLSGPAVFEAAFCAVTAYLWWRGGGGRRYPAPFSLAAPQIHRSAPHRSAAHLTTVLHTHTV